MSPQTAAQFISPARSVGDLPADVAAKVIAGAGDVAIVLDRNGIIRDMAMGSEELAREALGQLIDRAWADTVADDSRPKIAKLLSEAAAQGRSHWREINHIADDGRQIPIRYFTVELGEDGRVVAIGRDLRAVAELQRRLLQAQQAMERDIARLREAEMRYRIVFQVSSEAVLIVEAGSRRIVEANPAAAKLLGLGLDDLTGQTLARLVHADYRDAAAGLLAGVQASARTETATVRTAAAPDLDITMSASLFRQERSAHFLVRLARSDVPHGEREGSEDAQRLIRVLNRMPDAFVVTDAKFAILAQNAAFLDFVQLAGASQLRGQPLDRFLGRPGVDMSVLAANLREHGSVRNFATMVRNQFGGQEEVEVSAVAVDDGEPPVYGFAVRRLGRRLVETRAPANELPRSVEQLTGLVGRVALKDIVRETTDIIERLCIEAALSLTGNNRASTAELLGLSRQSLYSKLHRYNLANANDEGDGAAR